jgi:hypothetical protein
MDSSDPAITAVLEKADASMGLLLDFYKTYIEVFKHISTVCAGVTAFVAAFHNNIAAATRVKFLIPAASASLLIALLVSIKGCITALSISSTLVRVKGQMRLVPTSEEIRTLLHDANERASKPDELLARMTRSAYFFFSLGIFGIVLFVALNA